MKHKNIFTLVAIIVLISIVYTLEAQCPMCRMSAESDLAAGGTEGKGLNKGILYLLSAPYLLVMVIGFIWYRNRKSLKQEDIESNTKN